MQRKNNQIILLVILVIGIVALIYGVRQVQNLRSKAQDVQDAFEFSSNEQGKNVERTGSTTFDTDTQDIKIRLNDPEAVMH